MHQTSNRYQSRRAFDAGGSSFSLEHLNPHEIVFHDNERGELKIHTSYGHDCFTHAQKLDDDPMYYFCKSSAGDRYFCTSRYLLSLDLPKRVETGLGRSIWQTNRPDRFVMLPMVQFDDYEFTYKIIFELDRNQNRGKKGADLVLDVITAHPYDGIGGFRVRGQVNIGQIVANRLSYEPKPLIQVNQKKSPTLLAWT